MRHIFASLLLVGLCLPVGGQIQLASVVFDNVQQIALGGAVRIAKFTSGTSVTGNSPSVSGNNVLGVVTVDVDLNTPTGVTWGAGNNMTACTGSAMSGSGYGKAIYYILNPTAGVSTITITNSNTFNVLFAAVYFLNNANQVNPIDNCSNVLGASSSSDASTATVNAPNEFVIADNFQSVSGATISAGSGSTQPSGVNGNNSQFSWNTTYQIPTLLTGSITMNVSSTASATWRRNFLVARSFGR